MSPLDRVVLFAVGAAFYAVICKGNRMSHMFTDDDMIRRLPARRAWENYVDALRLSRRGFHIQKTYWKRIAEKSLDAYFARIERDARPLDIPPQWRKLAGV